jgi:hypothetical protein
MKTTAFAATDLLPGLRAREAQPLIGALRQSKATVSGKNNEDLSEHYQSWPDEAKADAGVMIGTDHDQLSTSAVA